MKDSLPRDTCFKTTVLQVCCFACTGTVPTLGLSNQETHSPVVTKAINNVCVLPVQETFHRSVLGSPSSLWLLLALVTLNPLSFVDLHCCELYLKKWEMSHIVCRTVSPSSGVELPLLSPHSSGTESLSTSTFLLRVSVKPWVEDLLSLVYNLAVRVDHRLPNSAKQLSKQWRQHEAVIVLCNAHNLSLFEREGDHCSWHQDPLNVSESQTKIKSENLSRAQLSTSDDAYSVVWYGHVLFLYAACSWSNAGIWNPGLQVRQTENSSLMAWGHSVFQGMTMGLLKALRSWGGWLAEVERAAGLLARRQVPLQPRGWRKVLRRSEHPAAHCSSVISLRGRKQASSRVLVFCKMGLEIEVFLMCETCHLFGNLAGRFTSWKLSVKGFVWEYEKVYIWGGGQVGVLALQGLMQQLCRQRRGLGAQPW